jgi:hypothetical protein
VGWARGAAVDNELGRLELCSASVAADDVLDGAEGIVLGAALIFDGTAVPLLRLSTDSLAGGK